MNNDNSGIASMLVHELAESLQLDEPFRAKQIFKWIAKGVKSFSEMSDLPLSLRQRLSETSLYSSSVDKVLTDSDGSQKLSIKLHDDSVIESVLLVDKRDTDMRLTACLSTQVGCKMGCTFCKTGSLGFFRNLTASEIVEQYIFFILLGFRPSNIVFMGMGEPLLNLDAVRKAIVILEHPDGFALSRRKITISTCGIVPGIIDLADNGPYVRLAVSLTSANDVMRSELMPVNKTWDLASLKKALLYYQAKSKDRITLEAAIMSGNNSSITDARAFAAWIKPLKAQVNIIAWNPVNGLPYKEPSASELSAYISELERCGINVVQRAKRGRGVMAACGQLGVVPKKSGLL